jgi:hypothetical protein
MEPVTATYSEYGLHLSCDAVTFERIYKLLQTEFPFDAKGTLASSVVSCITVSVPSPMLKRSSKLCLIGSILCAIVNVLLMFAIFGFGVIGLYNWVVQQVG